MKRCFYILSTLITIFIISCCLSSKAHAATTQVYLSNTPVGTIIYPDEVTDTGYSAYDLIRGSMYESIEDSMTEFIKSNTYTGNDDKLVSLGTYAFNISMQSWASFLETWWETSKLSEMRANNANYLVFSVNGAMYSLILDSVGGTGDKIFGTMTLQEALRLSFFECFTPYTVCIYSPRVDTGLEYELASLGATSLTNLTTENVFLDYIVHPILGVIPVEGNFSSPRTVYLSYAQNEELYKGDTRVLANVIYSPLKMGSIFGDYDNLIGSYDYKFWMLMHGVQDDDVYAKITVKDDTLLPVAPYGLVIRSETAQPFTYLYLLVPVAYVRGWVPTNTYGLYSMYNRTYERVENGEIVVKDVTPYSSALTYFNFEQKDGCVGRVTLSDMDNINRLDVALRLSYLEIYRDDMLGAAITTEQAVSYGAMGLSLRDNVQIVARPQIRSIVYLNIHDGYYYRVNNEMMYLQSSTDGKGFGHYQILDSEGQDVYKYHSSNNLKWSVTLEDLMDETKGYQIVDKSNDSVITVEEWLARAEKAGRFSRLLYNYAVGSSKKPFSSDIVFSYTKLNKAETSFKFLIASSNPNYRAYFSEIDTKQGGTATVMNSYGVSTKAEYDNYGNPDFVPEANYLQLAHCEERHLVAIPCSVYESISVTDVEEHEGVLGSIVKRKVNTYVETGRRINIDYTGSNAIDMTLQGQAFQYANNNTTQAQGVFYNRYGRISTAKDPTDNLLMHEMRFFLDSGHPTLVLSNAYVEQSGLLVWLQTSDAAQFMTQYTKETGYSAGTLYTRLTTSGVNFGFGVDSGDNIDRLLEIEDELHLRKELNIQSGVFVALSLVGILLIAYAACLVVAYYLDIFNTFASISILNIITFGGCRAVHTKQELLDMGITDAKQRRKYITLSGILVRWAVCTLFGILLFSSSKVFIWAVMIYEKLTALFGL